MTQASEQILNAALALPPGEREQIARQLWDSLGRSPEAANEVVWGQEAQRRVEAYQRGEIEAVPYDEAMRAIREQLKR